MLQVEEKKVRDLLFQGAFGLEKEGLRVTEDGRFSHSIHPFGENSHIVRDFSENQTEINTGISRNAKEVLQELERHTRIIHQTLENLPEKEYLWPFSNPPYIENEDDIPVAVFNGEEYEKTEYREYLSDRYGRYKMSLCGIHVNYSFSEELLQAAFAVDKEKDFRLFKDQLYLHIAEGLTAYGWIVTAVTAASPVMDGSYMEKRMKGKDMFLGMASVRCGELGYWNHFAPTFDYSSVQAYADSVEQYVQEGLISYPSELYYPIRLKPKGENSLQALWDGGVNHIELRMVDLNPLTYVGVEEKDILFIQLLLIWLAASTVPHMGKKEQVQAVQNFKNAAHYDLKTVKIVMPGEKSCSVASAGLQLLGKMKEFYRDFSKEVLEVLEFTEEKFLKPEKRYAWIVQERFGEGYMQKGMEWARKRQAEGCKWKECR